MSPSNENANRKTNLTAKTKKAIIEILTKFTATNPVTISTISRKIKIKFSYYIKRDASN